MNEGRKNINLCLGAEEHKLFYRFIQMTKMDGLGGLLNTNRTSKNNMKVTSNEPLIEHMQHIHSHKICKIYIILTLFKDWAGI